MQRPPNDTTKQQRKAVAIILCRSVGAPDDDHKKWFDEADEVIAALALPKTVTPDQPQAVPDVVLVPREPTKAMMHAFLSVGPMPAAPFMACYAAMLAARPLLPVETPAEGLRDPQSAPKDGSQFDAWVSGELGIVREADTYWNGADWQSGAFAHNQFMMPKVLVGWLPIFDPAAPAPLSGRDGNLREAASVALRFLEAIEVEESKTFPAVDELRAALAAIPPKTAEMEGETGSFDSADDFEEMCDALDIKPDAEHWQILCEMEIAARKAAEAKAERAAEDERDRLYLKSRMYGHAGAINFLTAQGAMLPADRLASRASSLVG